MGMIQVEYDAGVCILTLDRPERRNAIDRATAEELAEAFRAFDASDAGVAVLTGAGGCFCAGADLKAIDAGHPNRLEPDGDAPLGPSRMELGKPVIAAIEGYAVAGGLELACWCDLRVCAEDATLGVFCRRVGVPLIDGGTVRLPRIIGLGRATDLILTGRPVGAEEAHRIGLVDRVVRPGHARGAAVDLARYLLDFPQACLRADLVGTRRAFDGPVEAAMREEFSRGLAILDAHDLSRWPRRPG